MHIKIISEFFKKYKCPGIAFSLQSSRCVSNEQPCFKTSGLYDFLNFYLVCFTFSISYLVLLFHLLYIFQFLGLFFVVVLSHSFIKWCRKASICILSLYIYYICILYILYTYTFFLIYEFLPN